MPERAPDPASPSMDLLILEPLADDVTQWLSARHEVRVAPELAADPRAFRGALYNVRALILPPHVAVDAQLLRFAPALRAVGRVSAGAENIDLEACANAGVEVLRSLTASAQAEAEFVVGAFLSMLRRVPVAGPDGMRVGRELGALTVGIVGMAPAARPMAQLLRAFGSTLLGYDPGLHASDALWQRWAIAPVSLRELFERSDAVCVQLNYFSRYHGLIGERFLPHARAGQVIVALSHSVLFDEEQLAQAMREGRVSAAWLDSVEPGLLDEGRPLAGIPTLQTSPRLASTTRESRERSAWTVARRLDELLAGAPAPPREFRPSGPGEPLDLSGGPASP